MNFLTRILNFITFVFVMINVSNVHADGGVDGMGGNLKKITKADFKKIVEDDLIFYVSDVVYRLTVIRDWDQDKLQMRDREMSRDLEEFLGPKGQEIKEVLKKASFYAVDGLCANNSDASTDPSGQICVSYQAFKNFIYVPTLVPKLLTMALHELSHLRGFTEDRATRWQLYFDEFGSGLDGLAVFVGNVHHERFQNSLERVSERLGWAMHSLLVPQVTAQNIKDACEYLVQASERLNDLTLTDYKNSDFFMRFIKYSYDPNGFSNRFYNLVSQCDRDIKATMTNLMSIIEDMNAFERALLRFESPLCVKDWCARGSGLKYNNLSSALLEWSVKKDRFLSSAKGVKVDSATQGHCRITSSAGQMWDLKKTYYNYGAYRLDLEPINAELPMYAKFDFSAVRGYHSSIQPDDSVLLIDFSVGKGMVLLESDGFAAVGGGFTTFLVSKVREKSSMRIGVVDSNTKFPIYLRNSIYHASGEQPIILKEYTVTCSL